jgi:hypothetical protein
MVSRLAGQFDRLISTQTAGVRSIVLVIGE